MKLLYVTLTLMFASTAFADYNELVRDQRAQEKATQEAEAQARAIKNRDEHNARLRAAAASFAARHGGAASMSEQASSDDYGYRSSVGGYISRIEFTLRDRESNDCVASEGIWGFWFNNGGPRVYISCKYRSADGTVRNGPSTESSGRVSHLGRRHRH